MAFWSSFEQHCFGGHHRSPANLRAISLFKLMVSALFLLFFGFWVLMFYGTQLFSNSGRCKKSWPLHEYVVRTPGCRIVDLAPHDPALLRFFKLDAMPGPIVCTRSEKGDLVKSTATHLYVDMEAARNFTLDDFHCCYRPFRRVTAGYNASGMYDHLVDYMNQYHDHCFPIFFNRPTLVRFMFVYVICQEAATPEKSGNETKTIYRDYFTFAIDSTKESWAPEKIHEHEKISDESEEEPEEEATDHGDWYSVLVLGFDGMSRLNFIRQMPRTMSFFEENGGITLLGFNKVGYNTFPNLVPILTGMDTTQLQEECWPSNNTVFDDCPFIWKRFKENGYFTAYGEDNTFVSTFSYQTKGFRAQPVDYYLKPFFVETEINLRVTKLEKFTSILCVGNKPNMVRFENAVRNFVSNMKNRLTFGVFWFNGVSHDYLNLPRVGDNLFRSMLDKLKAEGALKSTVLIGLSDHGVRWGNFRQTFQGFLEERLPLATIVLPDSFKARYPKVVEALAKNAYRLSTPFDIYKTLLDILYRKHPTVSNSFADIMKGGYGVSLFTKIRTNRTCRTAGVPDEWCACSRLHAISQNNSFARRLANAAVGGINRLLRNETQCSPLSVKTITAVWEDIPATVDVNRDYHFSDYVINFVASPGEGRFEARLRVRHSYDKKMKPMSLIKIIGLISRLNMYKNHSFCVGSSMLKLYCHCSTRDQNVAVESQITHAVQNVQSSFSLVDLDTASLKTSERRKLGKMIRLRTQMELAKNSVQNQILSIPEQNDDEQRFKQIKTPTQPRVDTRSELKNDDIVKQRRGIIKAELPTTLTFDDIDDTINKDFAVTGSNMSDVMHYDEEENFTLSGRDKH